MAKDYRPPQAEEMFPVPKVGPGQLASWKDNPMSAAVLALVYQKRYQQTQEAFRKDESEFLIRKGEVKALDWFLSALGNLEDDILKGEEDENA